MTRYHWQCFGDFAAIWIGSTVTGRCYQMSILSLIIGQLRWLKLGHALQILCNFLDIRKGSGGLFRIRMQYIGQMLLLCVDGTWCCLRRYGGQFCLLFLLLLQRNGILWNVRCWFWSCNVICCWIYNYKYNKWTTTRCYIDTVLLIQCGRGSYQEWWRCR